MACSKTLRETIGSSEATEETTTSGARSAVSPFEDAAAELLGQRFGALAGAVHDEEMRDAAVAQGRDDLLADGAGAENEGGAVGQFAEDALGKLDAGSGNGHGARA